MFACAVLKPLFFTCAIFLLPSSFVSADNAPRVDSFEKGVFRGPRGHKGKRGKRGSHGACGCRGQRGHRGARGHRGPPGFSSTLSTPALFDEFSSGGTDSGAVGSLGWAYAGSAPTYVNPEKNHPGILAIPGATELFLSSTSDTCVDADCDLEVVFRFAAGGGASAQIGFIPSEAGYDGRILAITGKNFPIDVSVDNPPFGAFMVFDKVVIQTGQWYKLKIVRRSTFVAATVSAPGGISQQHVTNLAQTIPRGPLYLSFKVFPGTTLQLDAVSLKFFCLSR